MTNILEATFGATSTADDVLSGVNLKGKRILVTGVSAGIGVETARSLVAHAAQVVGAARDLNKAKAAIAGMGQSLSPLLGIDTHADRMVPHGPPHTPA